MLQEDFNKNSMTNIKENKMYKNLCNFHIIYIKNIMKKCNRKKCSIKNIMEVIVIEKYGQEKIKKDSQYGEH
jgi:hypothetical protein